MSETPNLTMPVDVDQNGILLGIQDFGVGFEDSTFFQHYAANTPSETSPVSLTPRAGPISGGTVSSPYGYYDITPDVWYGTNRGTASIDSSNSLTITSPPGNANGPVNLKYIYPNGDPVFTPQAFSYSVYPQYSILSGASAGTQIQVPGSGFVAGATALVGGQSATISVVDENTLTLTIPSVASGPQDLTITNPDGSTYTLKSAIAVP